MKLLAKAIPAALLLAAVTTHAQIATDGTVGARVTLSGRNIVISETLGQRMGNNLLHSFSTFNVGVGERATFSAVAFVQNFIARVTGGTASQIDGTIAASTPGSNVYLINPSGIVFGPTAAIDVPGSFHASTAHYLRLADGTRIPMTATPAVTLTFAPPAAFGFNATAAPIVLRGTQLRVSEGRRISLTGGDVALGAEGTRPSLLFAPSGTIGIAAVGSAGEAVIEDNGLRTDGFSSMGNVAVRGSIVSVVEGAGRRGAGSISIAGSDVTLDHATLNSATTFGPGRGIVLTATGTMTIAASEVISVTHGAGAAGPLSLRGRDITISNGSLVDTSCESGCTGTGGALGVNATGTLTLLGDNPEVPTYLVSNSFGGGRTGAIDVRAGSLVARGNALIQGIAEAAGNGSSITLTTGSISLTDGAQVDVSTRGSGRGGTLTVNNAGAIRIDGTRIADATTGNKAPSGFFSHSGAGGAAGGIVVATASLEILRGGEISSSALRGSSGAGGRISINASGALRVSGTDADGKSSGISSNTFTGADAGDIEINADTIRVDNRGRIQVQSEGAGRAGSARIVTRTMTLASQGQVSSDARSGGNGGRIDVSVRELLAIDGGDSGLFAKTYGPARGGSIGIAAGEIRLTDGGGIFAGTDGSGPGGDLVVRSAGNIAISGDSRISVESLTTGLAGSIEVMAADALTIDSGGRITSSARQADGGDIRVAAGRFGFIDGGRITTEVGTGRGSGGNVDLRIPMLVMRSGVITANAFGGSGGNIRIGTTTFVPSGDSRVTASSTLGIDGTITLESPALDPTGELLVPPPAFIDAGAVLAGRCGPRLAGRASSLIVAPRANSAAAPDGWTLAAVVPEASWSRPLACLAAVASAS